MHAKLEDRELRRSREMLSRAREVLPVCAQTFSKSPMVFVQGVAPNFVSRCKGAYVWDVDGNRYVDSIMGLGSVILGHAWPAVNEAAHRQMDEGMSFSLPHPIEVEVAEKMRELVPCAEMSRFGKNGSDVTSAAVRVARAHTGRDKVACCGYHGWQDWYIGSTTRRRGVPKAVCELTFPFPYNDLDALHAIFRDNPGQIACVIMEPILFAPPAEGYLQAVKELCHRHRALLIFDEVLTGFRLTLGGAHSLFGVDPDLACFGKAVANGFPLSIIVGRAEVMKLFEEVFFSSTFGGDALSLTACKATLSELKRLDVVSHLRRTGERVQRETNRLAKEAGLQDLVSCTGLPSWTIISTKDKSGNPSLLMRSLFQQEVMKRGLLTLGLHPGSYSHDEAAIDQMLGAYTGAFEVMADAVKHDQVEQRLEGPPIQAVFRQA